MGAFYLYRGKLHRPADAPRVWQMPPRALTLSQFRDLTQRRDRAIARLAEERSRNANAAAGAEAAGASSSDVDRSKKGKELAVEEEGVEGGGEKMESDEVAEEENGGKGPEEKPAKVEAAPADSTVVVKMEESKTSDGVSDREKRKQEVEKKLQVLKEKKHNLVQILKLILNAEEEFKRRNAQSAALRSSVPLQVENPVDMSSVTRHVPKLSVEVNFGADSGAESDATANPNSHGRQVHHLHSTSPSAGPFPRPSHQNAATPRTSLVATGHGTPSNILNASGAATATSSPSRFAPTGHHGHHQSSSLPPVSAPGSQFAASSPSPAASGGASSAFKDSRLTNSS